MHILYVTASAPYSFGEAFIAPEIEKVREKGHCVTVVPLRPRRTVHHADAASFVGSTVRQPLISPRIVRDAVLEFVRAPLRSLAAISVVMHSRSVPVLLKNLAVLPKGLWLARLARGRSVDHIHAHWAATTATTALVASVVSKTPWSYTAHRWDIAENNLIEQKTGAARFARAIDARGGRELAALAGPHGHKLRVIHMGVAVDSRRTGADERAQSEDGPFRVVIGAHLFEKKGHVYAFDAVARLRASGIDVRLDCVGEGPLRTALEAASAASGVSAWVRFLGTVNHAEFLARLNLGEWDVALLPSISTGGEHEGIPVFLAEAMAAGVPVVSTETGGIPELLEGGAGLLVPERDAAAIAAALTRLARDGQLRQRLAAAALCRVRERFSVDASVSALLELIV